MCYNFKALAIFWFFADNVDSEEAKNVFESNFSHIYLILYDNFVLAEANLRQRGMMMACTAWPFLPFIHLV